MDATSYALLSECHPVVAVDSVKDAITMFSDQCRWLSQNLVL